MRCRDLDLHAGDTGVVDRGLADVMESGTGIGRRGILPGARICRGSLLGLQAPRRNEAGDQDEGDCEDGQGVSLHDRTQKEYLGPAGLKDCYAENGR